MKKLFLLLFSILNSFNSLGETYYCTFTCYTSTTEACNESYKRVNNRFITYPGMQFFTIEESDKYISLSENSISIDGFNAGVSVAIINKRDLSFITARTQLMDVLPEGFKRNLAREGFCRID